MEAKEMLGIYELRKALSGLAVGADETTNTMETEWSELPPELLSKIAEGLGLIDLLGFRGVCKNWHSSTSVASAEIESTKLVPWFLVYGVNSQCTLLSNESKRYTITIPELEGATCLASSSGWLLIFNRGNIFFFSPFSRARIDLPPFPISELLDHVAAFTSPPTSPDCSVCLIHRSSDRYIRIDILRRGEQFWTQSVHVLMRSILGTVNIAVHHRGQFQLFDDHNTLVTFTPECLILNPFKIVPLANTANVDRLQFRRFRMPFLLSDVTKESGLGKEFSSIKTCGTLTNSKDIFFNEKVYSDSRAPSVEVKGVWIEPRFHQISERQRQFD